MKRLTMIPALAFTLVGCDFIYGVSRSTPDTLQSVPDISCVTAVLPTIPGVTDVAYETELGGRPLTWHGVEKPNQLHRFRYKYNGLFGNFFFETNFKGHTAFYHSYLMMNRRPPQSDIDQIHPVMLQIESAIEAQCDVSNLRRTIRERCQGVSCTGA
jgi:hypothetical protein